MKTFEEKWTAWLDGQLAGKELEDFEASLPDKEAAEAEKRDVKKLGTLLKQELGPQPFSNEEFFSHQLRERIGRESAQDRHGERSTWWTLRRLTWAGATSLALFFICAFFVIRAPHPGPQSEYLTQILNMQVDPAVSPNATISVFETQEDRVTVIWTEGLQSLPSDYAAK
jgi:anti-sigma factor RsiW